MERVIYAKFSRERKSEYGIVTRIVESDCGRRVEKSALTKQGASHISKIYSNMNILKNYYLDRNVVITPCSMRTPDTIEFSYVDGIRYDKYFSELTHTGNVAKIVEELKRLKDILYHVSEVQAFSVTEGFEKVFGKKIGIALEGKKAYTISNIDMIFSNMIIRDEKIYITDYEWVFEFSVPIDYVLYRSLLLDNSFSMLKKETKQTILENLNISNADAQCYEKMEDAFQMYVSGRNVFSEYKKNSMKKILRLEDISPKFHPNFVQVIERDGEKSIISQSNIQYRDEVNVKQTLASDTRTLKVQFCVESAVLKLKECYALRENGEKILPEVKHNASLVINDDYYFDNGCPYFEFENDNYDSFYIKVLVYYENSSIIGSYIKKIIECEVANQKLAAVEKEIEQMKNTKAWKLYTTLKKIQGHN